MSSTNIYDSDEHRALLVAWLAEHGIDANQVPADAAMYADRIGRTLTVEMLATDPDGQPEQVILGTNTTVRYTRKVPLIRTFSEYLAEHRPTT